MRKVVFLPLFVSAVSFALVLVFFSHTAYADNCFEHIIAMDSAIASDCANTPMATIGIIGSIMGPFIVSGILGIGPLSGLSNTQIASILDGILDKFGLPPVDTSFVQPQGTMDSYPNVPPNQKYVGYDGQVYQIPTQSWTGLPNFIQDSAYDGVGVPSGYMPSNTSVSRNKVLVRDMNTSGWTIREIDPTTGVINHDVPPIEVPSETIRTWNNRHSDQMGDTDDMVTSYGGETISWKGPDLPPHTTYGTINGKNIEFRPNGDIIDTATGQPWQP